MSQFTPTFTAEFPFDGDVVTVSMKRLKRRHMLQLVPFLSPPAAAAGAPEKEASPSPEAPPALPHNAGGIPDGEAPDSPETPPVPPSASTHARNLEFMRMVEEGLPVLRECIVSFEGLTDAAGRPLAFDDVCEEFYFARLTGEILARLMEESRLGSGAEKKSEPPASGASASSQRGPATG